MFKPLSSDVKAVDRTTAVKPSSLLDEQKRHLAELAPLIKGKAYSAKILNVAINGDLKVSIEGRQLILNMQQHWQIGDTLTLKYLGDKAGIHFQLVPQTAEKTAHVNLSATAREIAEHIKLLNREHATSVYQATIPATNQPSHVKQFAADLQHTLETTGLFYESHLADFTQGTRTLNSLLLEPQNQGSSLPHLLMAQQLQVLETQRVDWHGEIWPGQLADWQVAVEDHAQDENQPFQEPIINSQLRLQLPELGNMSIKIRLLGGKLTVALVAEETSTTYILKTNSQPLIQALNQHAVKLTAISIAKGDASAG